MAKAAAPPTERETSLSERARALLTTRRLSISPHILELLTLPTLEDLEADYRPRISENLKIGYAISDCATQTDGSEITDLKEFTVTTKTLIEFTNSLYDEFMRYKIFLNTQYEDKIKEHAFSLWEEMNDRLEYIEQFYKQKEAKMRQSYQQQLCDALAILKTKYLKYFRIGKGLPGEEEEMLATRFGRLRECLEEKQFIITGLEGEIVAGKARESEKLPHEEEFEFEKELLQQENREMREEIASLKKKLARLQEVEKQSEKDRVELDTEIKQLQNKRERDRKTIEKLTNTQEMLKLEVDREKQRVLSKAREVKEAHEALAKLTESAAKSEVEAAFAAKAQAIQQQRHEKMSAKELREAAAREAAAREAAAREGAAREAATSKAATTGEAKDLDILFGSQQELLAALSGSNKDAVSKALLKEVARLKQSEREAREQGKRLEMEIRHLSEAWELKFQILKRSFRVGGGNGGVGGGNGGIASLAITNFFTPIAENHKWEEKEREMVGRLKGSTLSFGLSQRVFLLSREAGYFRSLADL
uniref:uncharacterized protein C10orf67 homolog, mitochondrial n=1 Tax=Euleptes europaea TaxID=460621 RepID=UPI002541CD79|nr:uncharacterized protein C10orf67 homolog, mitochondrial [Euleptes europaea]